MLYKKQFAVFFFALSYLGFGYSPRCSAFPESKVILAGAGSLAAQCGDVLAQHRWKVLGSLVAGYGYKLVRHWWKLYSIEKELRDIIVEKNKNFSCISWCNAQYDTPKVIHDGFENVSGALARAINAGEFSDELGNKIKKASALKAELSREKESLRQWLLYVASMCDAPKHIKSFYYQSDDNTMYANGLSFSYAFYDNDKLLQYVERGVFRTTSHADLCSIEATLKKARAPHRGASIIFLPYWMLPWNWVVAPCYTKARDVYLQIFREYIRLKALEEVADLLISSKLPEEPKPNNVHVAIQASAHTDPNTAALSGSPDARQT